MIILGLVGIIQKAMEKKRRKRERKGNGKKVQEFSKGNGMISKHFGCFVENYLAEKVDEGRPASGH